MNTQTRDATAVTEITAATLDYVEGWFDADAERMRRALHPELVKRCRGIEGDNPVVQPGGTTEYADAMAAAGQELTADGRTGVQKVMVVLSDGAANTGQHCSAQPLSVDCMQPCQAGVNEAATLKAAPNNVLVYTILYGPPGAYGDCTDFTGVPEVPAITPQTAMSEMASPGNYYPDPNPANLTTIFQQIASDISAGTARIVQ